MAIIRHPRWNPIALIVIAACMVPLAVQGVQGLMWSAVVWLVVAAVMWRWWRTRTDPRPPDHSV
jgi:hypothetical protein